MLYIGSGLDLQPLKSLGEMFDKFIFVDSLPLNGHGYPHFCRELYDPLFVEKVCLEFVAFGFSFISKEVLTNDFCGFHTPNLEATLYTFGKGDTIAKYYCSTCIPRHLNGTTCLSQLKRDIQQVDTLLVCGYCPHMCVLDYAKKPWDVLLYSGSHLVSVKKYKRSTVDREDLETLFCKIVLNPPMNTIKSLSWCPQGGSINDIQTFSTYDELYQQNKKM